MWEFNIGKVVRHKMSLKFGHVTGFAMNASEETIVKVRWQDGQEYPIHPIHLEYKETE